VRPGPDVRWEGYSHDDILAMVGPTALANRTTPTPYITAAIGERDRGQPRPRRLLLHV
jgi:hypothetical protein